MSAFKLHRENHSIQSCIRWHRYFPHPHPITLQQVLQVVTFSRNGSMALLIEVNNYEISNERNNTTPLSLIKSLPESVIPFIFAAYGRKQFPGADSAL